jgi:hypothetical protein
MSPSPAQSLRVLTSRFTLEHLAETRIPSDDSWVALVRAPEGLTVVREADASDQSGLWVGLYGGDTAHGLDVPGMLAALVGPLAAAGVPVFVASTFHADLVLVPLERRADAFAALRGAGHEVADADDRLERSY